MSLNPLQITSTSILTQLPSQTHTDCSSWRLQCTNKRMVLLKGFKSSNNNTDYFEYFQSLYILLGVFIKGSKQRYCSRLSNKLLDPSSNSKTYWYVLNLSCIPLNFHENRFVADFKEKTELFNSFFSTQYSVINNASKIPSTLHLKAEKSLSSIMFTEKDIEKVMPNLN